MSVQNPPGDRLTSDGPQGDGMRGPNSGGQERVPLHRGFVGAGAILLISAFGTDCVYYTTALWQWANFSAWLITAGLVVTLAAGILLLVDFATGRARRLNPGTFAVVVAAGALALTNAFIHSRDAWSSVVPQGIGLSAVSAVLLLVAGFRGWSLTRSLASGARP